MNINLEYYKMFYYVAKYQTITAAAEVLMVSQPAVSQGVKQLERELGTTLFIRNSKGVRLTAAGETLYSYVSHGYQLIQNGEKEILEMLNLEAGEVRIGASDMTLQFFLLPYLQKFHEKYPKIKVHVTNAPTPETLAFLQEGRIDFGVVSTPIMTRYGVERIQVQEIEDVFVAGSSFERLKGRKIKYKELEQLPMICLEENTSTRTYLNRYLEEKNVILHPEFELATSSMIVQFAQRNLGIASVVKDFAREQLANGSLFELEFEERIPTRNMCVVTNPKIPMASAAKRLFHMMNLAL